MMIRMHLRGLGLPGRRPALKGIRLLKFTSQQSPLSNFGHDNGRQDTNASCQCMLHPGDHGRKHRLELERPQVASVIKCGINNS